MVDGGLDELQIVDLSIIVEIALVNDPLVLVFVLHTMVLHDFKQRQVV